MEQAIHNPDRYMSEFRQIISNGQKRIGFLIGAGAPMNIRTSITEDEPFGLPLIPDVKRLTAQVLNLINGVHGVVMKEIVRALEPDANIESILSRIRQLSNAIGDAKVYEYNGQQYGELADAICKSIGEIVDKRLPAGENCYTKYVAWISGTSRQFPVETFTTNYDLLFEEAFERNLVPYFDGFTGSREPFFDATTISTNNLPSNWSRLWKMHGSLGWELRENKIVRTGKPDAHTMIFPETLKYDKIQKMPYTAFFERFKAFMRTPDTLLITSGFSFADSHIGSVIDEALAQNHSLSVFTFNYGSIEDAPDALREIASRRSNMSVYADTKAIINCTLGEWKIGEPLNREWPEIRQSFWKAQPTGGKSKFTLGSFLDLTNFLINAKADRLGPEFLPPPAVQTIAMPLQEHSN